MLIPEFLSISSMLVPDRTALDFEGQRFSFSQLKDRVNRVANALTKLGLQKGDRAAIIEVNCNEYVEAIFGTIQAGGIFAALSFRARGEETTYLINKAEPKVLFVGSRYIDQIKAIQKDLPSVKHYVVIDAKAEGMINFDEMVASASPEENIADMQEEDTAILMFTAGTTGFPKGVPHDHNAYSSYVLNNVAPPDIDAPAETNVLAMPMYHVAGMQATMAAIYGGRTIAIMRQFDEKEWFETIQRVKATRVMVVPTMLKRIVEFPDFDKYDLSSIKVVTYGAAACPYEVLKQAIEKFPGRALINAFGGTETASTITALRAEDQIITGKESPAEKEKKLKRLSGSIGMPMKDVEIQIRGEDGKPVPQGQLGEVVARGPRIMKGYWKDDEKTKSAFTKDGWYRMGDMGYIDDDGYIFLAGRADDVIVRGGENIGPDEVESVLYSHPAVEEAAVIGVKDIEWGQDVRAIVRLKKGKTATEKEIIDFTRPLLAGFKRPSSIIFVTEELPKTPTGKIIRKTLREQYGKK